MASSIVNSVRIAGLASAIPESVRSVADDVAVFGNDVYKISDMIGVKQRHIAPPHVCTSDLCAAAAEKLLHDLGWDRSTIDALVFVTQTPDYLLPASACSLHGRLGLAKRCAAFDVNQGCSGYVYGLWLASLLVAGSDCKRAVLLAGDTISRIVSPEDRATALLFGDAGSATALERVAVDDSSTLFFELGTDGTGAASLIVPAGGFRTPHTGLTSKRVLREDGNTRSEEDLFMQGADIFSFTLREVPPLINGVLALAGWTTETPDAFVFHQANRFMLQHLAKRLKIPAEKFPITLGSYGNTSSASIPLAITDWLSSSAHSLPLRLVLAGFGVGFSWGAAALSLKSPVLPELVVLPA